MDGAFRISDCLSLAYRSYRTGADCGYLWLRSLATEANCPDTGEVLMLPLPERVLLACGATDLRKSIDDLAALVQQSLGVSPFSPTLFVFCNRDRDKLKMLYWDHNGFWLSYRRLERHLPMAAKLRSDDGALDSSAPLTARWTLLGPTASSSPRPCRCRGLKNRHIGKQVSPFCSRNRSL